MRGFICIGLVITLVIETYRVNVSKVYGVPVLAVFQIIAVGFLSRYMSAIAQVALGFALMGSGIFLLLMARSLPIVLGVVAILAFGMALIFFLLSLISDCY